MLELGDHELDVVSFAQAADAANEAVSAERWGDATQSAERALSLWRGPPYQELRDDGFARPEVVRLEETRLGLLETRAAALLELGRVGSALPQLERVALENPLRERLWELLMRGRAQIGRTADALAAYHDLRGILDEMGLEPAPALRELHARILREDPELVGSGDLHPAREARRRSTVPGPTGATSAGTVAFLFADLSGSTGLLAEIGPVAYSDTLRDYRAAVEDAVAEEGGHVVDREGDGLFLVVPTAAGALRAAAAAQRRIAVTDWPQRAEISVRMGIHVGEAHAHDDGYVGLDVNRAARIGGLAHGGQVLVSEAARLLATDGIGSGMRFRDLGVYELKGIPEPVRVHQLVVDGLRDEFPPIDLPSLRAGQRLEDARSVAVLPFEVVGSGTEAEFLAVGLHNDLITELSKVRELTVISRTSVLRYAGGETPIPRVAQELDVGTVIEGAVQAVGDRIRMTVQLIDGIADAHRWAESYDRGLTTENLFDIQTELVKYITESLHAELVPAPSGAAQPGPPTDDLDAYRLAVQARQRFDLKTEEGFLEAIELFERAIELDPDYADAWIGLADSLALMEDYGYGDREELLAQAEVAVRRALELAPDSAGAHTSLGLLHSTYQDGPATVREFEHAIRLQPSYADAHNWHAWISLILGRAERALASAHRAVELNPLSAEPVSNLALANIAVGEPEEGLVESRRSQELSPFTTGVFYEGLALYDLGRYEEARDVLEPLDHRRHGDLTVHWARHGPDVTLALVLAELDELDEAEAVLRSIDPDQHPFAFGLIQLGLDRVDDAVSSFARVREMSAWPSMAIHLFYRGVWHRVADEEAHERLVRTAHRRWNLE